MYNICMKWVREHKRLVIVASLIVALLIPLTILGLIYKNEISVFFVSLLENLGFWKYVLYILITSIGTILLSVVPAVSMAFIMAGVGLFGATWQTFLICASSVFISSLVMYLLGRTGGYKLFMKIIGKDNLDKATKLIKEKGQIYFPLMMMFGGFPDDALVCVAGIIKMNLWFFIPSVIIGRSIGIASIVFGLNFIQVLGIDSPLGWFKLIVFGVIGLMLVIKLGNIISKKINAVKK